MTNKGSSKTSVELAEEFGVPVAKARVAQVVDRKPTCVCEECASVIYDKRNVCCHVAGCPIHYDSLGGFIGVRHGYAIGSTKPAADPSDMDPCDCTNCGCK